MNGYKLFDRTKEISSLLGLVLVLVAVFVGFKLSPDDPFKFVPVLLAALGGLGVAVPDKQGTATAEDFALKLAQAFNAVVQANQAAAPAPAADPIPAPSAPSTPATPPASPQA